ncbi:exopolysaccharide biosynthesis polyprenyl glycosylphosphotransferase [Cellulomonas aerilata]|uniref:Exopolysaccharide biosynthesis polyprenyl glycosylphosphotransferase n=1 Tax=Cellulomonas aerilata TaxID=515326 RepID=A0A512DDT0_9CELL|nr:exopolysaccharide biosynthesis polyprenyl glycosylphosphotransferase [Cellulomonas aerilata]
MARGYVRTTVLLDATVAALVALAVLVPLMGVTTGALGGALVGAALFVLMVALFRGYDPDGMGDGPGEFQAVLRGGSMVAVALMTAAFTLDVDISRALVFLGAPALIVASSLARYGHRHHLHHRRTAGEAMMRTIVVGEPEAVEQVVGELSAAPFHGYQVTGVCLPSLDNKPPMIGRPVLGAISDLPQVVVDNAIDVVIVAGHYLSGSALRRLSWALGRTSAQLVVAPDLVEVTGPRLSVRPTAGLSLLEVEIGAPRRRLVAKTVLDRTAATLGLLALSPVIGGAALAVKLTSPGPAFYRQTRVGVDGSTFTIWKLRSMYVDADARRDALLEQNEGQGLLFKMRQDPRVTPVGRVLRRYSIDELPQLFNVVRGEMSLVGPRPPLVAEVEAYPDMVQRRLHVKPGLTGLWQVSGRSDLSWDEAVRLDLRYVDNWSVAMDLMILWKTGRAVFAGSGAY